jgi:hypothetical protein
LGSLAFGSEGARDENQAQKNRDARHNRVKRSRALPLPERLRQVRG